MTLALVLQSCAHAAGPASSSAPVAAASLPVDCLDLQGQRELLAGVELELGAQAAQLARCNIERGAALKYGDSQAQRAQSAEQRLQWAVPVAGVVGAVLSAVLTAVVEAYARPKPATPAGAK